MTGNKVIISPKTKVGEFLEAYPELESLLLEMSPAFSKLKNPILRNTIGKVASLQQAAAIGGLKIDEMVNRLRHAAGQSDSHVEGEDTHYLETMNPSWFDESKITIHFDASSIINSGGSPMNEILSKTKDLKDNEILKLQTPFVPAPIIDILKKKGFRIFSIKKGDVILTYIEKLN